jgi:hypothetical protein
MSADRLQYVTMLLYATDNFAVYSAGLHRGLTLSGEAKTISQLPWDLKRMALQQSCSGRN